MIGFSCADFTFPLLSHEKALALIAMMDFKWVDIGLFQDRSHIQPSDQLDKPALRGQALNKLTRNMGLDVADIFFQAALDFEECGINHPDGAVRSRQRDLFERAMDYTLAAGCKNFSGLPGVDYGLADSHAICVEELSWRVERAKKDGITYSVEPHFGSIMSTPEDALRMLKEVRGLTIVLDHSHYTHQGISVDRVAPMTHYASHMHARGAAKGEMQTSVSRNETDFRTVCQHITKAEYTGWICMEYTYVDWENCNRTDNVSETILLRAKLAEYLGIDL